MTMKTNRSLKAFFLSASVAALSLGTVAPLAGQTAAPVPQASEVEMSDAKLEAFVTALLGVEEVRVDYTPQIEAAASEEEQADAARQTR